MSIDISKLRKQNIFENDKIKITFSPGSVSHSLCVHIKDEKGKLNLILWELSPDRCHQKFDIATEKIRTFVQGIIDEWVKKEEEDRILREEMEQKRKSAEEDRLKKLMENF